MTLATLICPGDENDDSIYGLFTLTLQAATSVTTLNLLI